MSCFYNIVKGCWDEKILALAGINVRSLPVVIPSDCVGGRVTEKAAGELDVTAGIPVVAGGHDQYCASLGAGAVNRGDCLLSCGTAWALLVITDKPFFIPESRWVPGRYLREKKYGLMAAIGNGGVILDWVKKNIRTGDFSKIKKESGIRFVPDFMEEKGAISNISLATTGSEIYYAAMRSLALTVKSRLEILQDRIEVNQLLMVGGGTRERLLPPLVEKETGIRVVMPDVSEAAGRGAALLYLGSTLDN
jgi:sugar (pentulose or hexulose) kinase